MTSQQSSPDPFNSLDALRKANEELLERIPHDDEAQTDDNRLANEVRIREFVERAVATGASLDTPSDRREAQALIDYWVADAYTSASVGPQSGLQTRRNVVLDLPDLSDAKLAAQQVDKFLHTASAKEQALTRKILLKLLRVADGGQDCVSAPARLDQLYELDADELVDRIVGKLEEAGALSITEDKQVALRHEALIRVWDELKEWVDRRISFRNAAQF